MFWYFVIGGSLFLGWVMYSIFMSRTPEVAFHLVKRFQKVELRKYEAHFRIKCNLNSTDLNSIRNAIKSLMNFLDGENEQRLTIKWIAPIMIEHNVVESHVSIVLPGQFTLTNLPKPLQKTIYFEQLPERIVAAKSYTWFNVRWRFEQAKKALCSELENNSIRAISPITEAIFQVNWILPWLCKYEVMVEVEYIND